MRSIQKVVALLAWFVIYVPTTLFVVFVMLKSIWATTRGKIYVIAGLLGISILVEVVRSVRGDKELAA